MAGTGFTRRGPLVMVATAAVLLTAMAACAPSGADSPSATAGASMSPSLAPASLTVHTVVLHVGPNSNDRQIFFANGHWLYPDDLNDTVVYDGVVVAHGHPVTAALSQNGLHYAYTLAQGLSIFVDGKSVATGTNNPDVFAVSDDGATVLYTDSRSVNVDGVIYRNADPVFRSVFGIGEAVGSADALHYTAVVGGDPPTLIHDGVTVVRSGIDGDSAPIISPDGSHFGVCSGAVGGANIDGAAILPGDGGTWCQVTDSGHWVILDQKQDFVPVVDAVVKGPPAKLAVISSDGQQVAEETVDGAVLVNGVRVAAAPADGWLEIEGSALYVYDIET